MKSQPDKSIEKLDIVKRLRLPSYVWVTLVGITLLVGVTFAWYSLQEREAETETYNVMKPYYLNLRDPRSTDLEQLSIGSLLQGEVAQIVFCVDTKEEEQVNKDTTTFTYNLELVHTDNMVLEYEIYPLQETAEGESDLAITEEVQTGEGETESTVTYWRKSGGTLTGSDVSATRHEQAGLTVLGRGTGDIVNRGTYIAYSGESNSLELTVGGGSYTSQYFVLEISWSITSGFDKYEKETDMIYVLAKAVQPEPSAVVH